MILTDEEIYNTCAVAMNDCKDVEGIKQWRGRQAIAKAQLRKVIEFLDRKTIELAPGGHRRIIISFNDWQSLLKEIDGA